MMVVGCEQQQTETKQERVNSVNVTVLELSDYKVQQTFTGSVEGEKQADLYAKVNEAVEAVRVQEGQTVTDGQVLIALDKTGPSSMYREAESVFRNAEKNFKKMEFLYQEDAISESQYDAARTEYEVDKASFEGAASLVDIKAPITGTVTAVDVSPGDYVSVGQKLATVATTDRLRIKFGVGALEVGFFKKGAGVEVSAEGIGQTAEGTIVAVAGSADPSSRAFQIEVLMDNRDGRFSPGMFVRVAVTLDTLVQQVIVPRTAVIDLNGVPTAFVVENAVARKRSVELGRDLNGKVVVESGLDAGDTLVVLGQTYLDEGMAVRIIEMETMD